MVMEDNEVTFVQLLAEARSKIKQGLTNQRISVTDAELNVVYSVMENAMRSYRLELELNPPRVAPSLNTITCMGNKVVGYHYVDGIRRQIVQITQGDKVFYYTDGIRENV